MTLEFQNSLLKFLFQTKEAKIYRECLDASLFDAGSSQMIFGYWAEYVKKYGTIPQKSSFIEYVDKIYQKHKGQMTSTVYNELRNVIAASYIISDDSHEFTKDVIIEYARRKGVRNLFTSYASKINLASVEELDTIFNEFRRVVKIGNDISNKRNNAGLLFRDADIVHTKSAQHAHPTYLHGINKTMASKGSYSPQLLLLLGGPKAFKTGTLLELMAEYARSGLNVYIADFENGADEIRTRLQQCFLGCEMHEVKGLRGEYKIIARKIKQYGGGDISVSSFQAGQSTLDDVDEDIQRSIDEDGFHPHVILYDYLAKARSTVAKFNQDIRTRLPDIMEHAVRINEKYGTFAWSAAKVRKQAVSKLIITPEDIAEDFAQVYNAMAGFALCRTEEEVKAGTGRIISVFQRAGLSYNYHHSTTCAIKIEPEIQQVTELDVEPYMDWLQDAVKQSKPTTKKKFKARSLNDD